MSLTPLRPIVESQSTFVWSEEEKNLVVQYLCDSDFLWLVSTGTMAVDTHTGEKLPCYEDTMKDEEGFYWTKSLAYFVDRYNCVLPRQFVDHVLNKKKSGWRLTRPTECYEYHC